MHEFVHHTHRFCNVRNLTAIWFPHNITITVHLNALMPLINFVGLRKSHFNKAWDAVIGGGSGRRFINLHIHSLSMLPTQPEGIRHGSRRPQPIRRIRSLSMRHDCDFGAQEMTADGSMVYQHGGRRLVSSVHVVFIDHAEVESLYVNYLYFVLYL